MTHHTWRHRFETALKEKNWKKILCHIIVEWSIIGTLLYSLESKEETLVYGVALAFIIHMIIFKAIDSIQRKIENKSSN